MGHQKGSKIGADQMYWKAGTHDHEKKGWKAGTDGEIALRGGRIARLPPKRGSVKKKIFAAIAKAFGHLTCGAVAGSS